MINPNIFREYDIRGIAKTDLTDKTVELIGKAYGTYIKGDKVIVGMDNRLSSKRIKKALIQGIISTGKGIIDIGLTISPIFYYSRILYGIEGGIMITGSHNPKEYNGFKLCKGEHTMFGRQIQNLRKIIEKGEFKKGKKGDVARKNPTPAYEKMLKERIKINKKFKVVVDCGNGAASLFAPKILKNWGCKVISLYCKSDGKFPNHRPDPSDIEALKDLIAKVKKCKADLGIGLDGDGDRIGVIDNRGNIVWGDMLQILFQREILAKHPGAKAIVEMKCSQALYDDVIAHGGKPIFWKTGHSLIKDKMSKEKVLASGEMSGHMFFRDEFYGTDDALYAVGRLLRILDKEGKSISSLLSDAPKYFSTPEIRLYCPDNAKFEIVKKIAKDFKKEYDVIDIDGARVLFQEGWGLVRASNTGPAISVRAEGKNKESLKKIKKIIGDKIKEFKEIKFSWNG